MVNIVKKKQNNSNFTSGSMFWILGILSFLLSSIYWNNGDVGYTLLKPYFVLYLMCGAFHAWNVWQVMILADNNFDKIRYLVALTFLFTGWYNAVLMPMSGIGFMQIVFTFFVLTSGMLSQLTSKRIYSPFSGQSPMELFYFGCIMYLVKVFFFYMFDSNIYEQFFLGNGTARKMLFIGVALCIVMLVLQLTKNMKNQVYPEEKSFIKNGVKIVGSFFKKILTFIVNTIKSLLSPAILLVVLLLGGFIVFGVAIWKMNQIYESVMNVIEPLMEKLLSTGKNKVVTSVPYYFCQTLTFFLVFISTAIIDKQIKSSLQKNIRQEIDIQVNRIYYERNLSEYQKRDLYNESCNVILNKNLSESFHYFAHSEEIKQIVYDKSENDK